MHEILDMLTHPETSQTEPCQQPKIVVRSPDFEVVSVCACVFFEEEMDYRTYYKEDHVGGGCHKSS